jgi:hypothetical protein
MTFLTFLTGLIGLIVTILWLVIGWRAMRAHEEIANSAVILAAQARKLADTDNRPASRSVTSQKPVDPSKLPKIRED